MVSDPTAMHTSTCSCTLRPLEFEAVHVQHHTGFFCGCGVNTCRMGMANAAVLPDPVLASPITSWPFRATGKDCTWMALGFFHPSSSMERHSSSHTPMSRKEGASPTGASPSSSVSTVSEHRRDLADLVAGASDV